MCRLSRNLGASISWNPQTLSRPVMGFLYLYLFFHHLRTELFYSGFCRSYSCHVWLTVVTLVTFADINHILCNSNSSESDDPALPTGIKIGNKSRGEPNDLGGIVCHLVNILRHLSLAFPRSKWLYFTYCFRLLFRIFIPIWLKISSKVNDDVNGSKGAT